MDIEFLKVSAMFISRPMQNAGLIGGSLNRNFRFLLFIFLLLLSVGSASADPFIGEFFGKVNGQVHELSVSAGDKAASYKGLLRVGKQSFRMSAHRIGGRIVGNFFSEKNTYGFVALMRSSDVIYVQDQSGKRIIYRRK